jgi:PPOX class probable F420-dependent enzyme
VVDDVRIGLIPPSVRRLTAPARVGHFATSNGEEAGLVPVCFVLRGETVYHALDAKPKSVPASELGRVRNLRANPKAVFLVDHYAEDWRRLWYVLFRGRARILVDGPEHRLAIGALRRKYRQYRDTLPLAENAMVIALDVDRLSQWRSSSRDHRRGAPVSRRA